MDDLTSPQGTLSLAVSALLLVLGYRIARPERLREWLALAAYAVALAAQFLGARALLPGPVLAASPALRIAGAVLLVIGLVVAGSSSRARRRAAMNTGPEPALGPRAPDRTYAGLALVVVGQLLRGPSVAGAVAVVAAVATNAFVALTPLRASRYPTRSGGGPGGYVEHRSDDPARDRR